MLQTYSGTALTAELTHNEYVLSAVVTDALVLKHQAISTHSAEQIFIALDQFHREILKL